MTLKHGFEGGLVAGFIAFLFLNGYVVFTPAPTAAIGLLTFLAVLVFPILSLVIGIGSVVVGHAIPDTTTDGFIYGFAAALDIPYILYILIQFYHGNLPLPWQT